MERGDIDPCSVSAHEGYTDMGHAVRAEEKGTEGASDVVEYLRQQRLESRGYTPARSSQVLPGRGGGNVADWGMCTVEAPPTVEKSSSLVGILPVSSCL